MSNYLPSRGGHAAGHLRDAFAGLVEEDQMPDEAEHHGVPLTAYRVIGLLWNCTDTMPSSLCAELDLPSGASYAQGSRTYRAMSPQS